MMPSYKLAQSLCSKATVLANIVSSALSVPKNF